MNKKLLITGISSLVVVAGCGVGAWALVSQSVNSSNDKILDAKNVIPNLVKENYKNYSSEWMATYSVDEDFDFTAASGYNRNVDYTIVKKTAVNQKLKLDILMELKNSTNSNSKREYSVELPITFSTPEASGANVTLNTIIEFPHFQNYIVLNSPPVPGTTIQPGTITFDSPTNFSIDPTTGVSTYKKNGAKIQAIKTLDSNNINVQTSLDDFEASYNSLITNAKLDIEAMKLFTKAKKTIILYQIDGGNGSLPSGSLVVKDFSNDDPSNSVADAREFPVVLNYANSTFPPTAQEIMDSFKESNPTKYLSFNVSPDAQILFNNFNYNMVTANVEPDDLIQDSINIEVEVSSKQVPNSKTYIVKIFNLLSIQQKQLNDLKAGNDNSWQLTPVISPSYQNQTITQIVDSPNLEAFMFNQSDLAKFPDYKYTFSSPLIAGQGTNLYINIKIEMISIVNPKVKEEYFVDILTGFVPFMNEETKCLPPEMINKKNTKKE